MLTPDLLHDYQKKLVNFQCTRPHSMIWADMGLGKTVTTLTSIVHLLTTGFLRGVIIVAPNRVIRLVCSHFADQGVLSPQQKHDCVPLELVSDLAKRFDPVCGAVLHLADLVPDNPVERHRAILLNKVRLQRFGKPAEAVIVD